MARVIKTVSPAKLRAVVGKYRGAQVDFAKKHRLSTGYLNNLIKGRNRISPRVHRIVVKELARLGA